MKRRKAEKQRGKRKEETLRTLGKSLTVKRDWWCVKLESLRLMTCQMTITSASLINRLNTGTIRSINACMVLALVAVHSLLPLYSSWVAPSLGSALGVEFDRFLFCLFMSQISWHKREIWVIKVWVCDTYLPNPPASSCLSNVPDSKALVA